MMTAKCEEFRQSLLKKNNEEMIQTAVVLFGEKEDALIPIRWRKTLGSLLMKAVSPV